MTKPIAQLMQKEMSRKEFLRLAGTGILGLIGVTAALQNLHKLAGTQATTIHKTIEKHDSGPAAYGK